MRVAKHRTLGVGASALMRAELEVVAIVAVECEARGNRADEIVEETDVLLLGAECERWSNFGIRQSAMGEPRHKQHV